MFKNSISVVVPAFNEQNNIKETISVIYNFLKNNFVDFEVIIVDDGSVDNTSACCKEMEELLKDSRLIVLRHSKNRGYGAALRTGLFSAKNDLVFYTDADRQFDISEIPNSIDYINDNDLVVGFRKNRQDPKLRKFCAYVYNRIIFFIFGLNVRDIDCSFKLFRKDALSLLSIDTDEFLVDTELLVKSKLHNLRIKQIPVTHYPRIADKSSVRIKHVFSTLWDLIFLYRKLKKEGKI